MRRIAPAVLALALFSPAVSGAQTIDTRAVLIERATLRIPIDTASLDLRAGPPLSGRVAPGSLITCDYLDKPLNGLSLKFACLIDDTDEVKVKFGGTNGEVQGEVVASRLLWALGFGADGMYPVRVICRGCPETFGEPGERPGERIIDPAVIERKPPGREIASPNEPGWSWLELDLIDEEAGGATIAERDALRLLAVFMQHTDTKPEQQRLVCLDNPDGGVLEPCTRPFLMLNDVGLTFGRANLRNANSVGSVNLTEWARTPVWRDPVGCVGNLPRSFTGTLKDPLIGEDGRRLLGGLLLQLTDRQLQDLFAVARVDLRARTPNQRPSAAATVEQWVDAFKQKRDEIVGRRCPSAWIAPAPMLFDTRPIVWLQSWASPALTYAMDAISLFGYTPFYIALAVVIAFSYRLREGAALLVLLTLAAAMTDATKAVVTLPRPVAVDAGVQMWGVFQPGIDTADAYGFPSGHVAASAAFLMGLALLLGWRRAWIAALVWVPLMGLSRMYLGRHFVADLLGGVAIAVISTAIVIIGLTLHQLYVDGRRRQIVARTLFIAIAVAFQALMLGFPSMSETGRLLGAAVGLMLVIWIGETPLPSMKRQALRIGMAAILFPAALWLAWFGLGVLNAGETRAATLIAHAFAGALLLAGPLLVERLLPYNATHALQRDTDRADAAGPDPLRHR